MMQNYQDAMALCRAYGNPDLFITFTSNPKWPEIGEMLAFIPGQIPYERPKVGTRVFKLKLTHLLDDLTKNEIFGKTYAVVYVIEFQKRGLPHAHILLWLEEEWKRCLHCGGQMFKKNSQNLFIQKPTWMKKGTQFTAEGIQRFRSKAIKYLFKYLNKGPDRATFVIQENIQKPAHGEPEKVAAVDEIKNYLNCRYLAPCEAVWRLFSFDIHYSYPSVMKLNFHLEDQRAITLRNSQNLPALLNREEIKITMFTEWFELNKRDTKSRELTYAEIPKYNVWHDDAKI
ncbi:DNA helicase PIF1, ATP-dependent [Tanacetum coccineum]